LARAKPQSGASESTPGDSGRFIDNQKELALGILFGRNSSADTPKKIYAFTERLVRDFEKQFGSRNCSDLLGCDISTREGETIFEAKKLGKTLCLDMTVKTTELVMQVPENHDNIRHSLVE
jgi:hypothetical protein